MLAILVTIHKQMPGICPWASGVACYAPRFWDILDTRLSSCRILVNTVSSHYLYSYVVQSPREPGHCS